MHMIRTGNDRWKIATVHQNCCSSDGRQPTTTKEKHSFFTKLCERISLYDKSGNPCELYTARGKQLPDQLAKIVSIFTTRWSVYDKFGQWSSLEPQLRLTRSDSGPSASALRRLKHLLEGSVSRASLDTCRGGAHGFRIDHRLGSFLKTRRPEKETRCGLKAQPARTKIPHGTK